MSLKRNCDGCGAVIEDGKSETNDYPDVAIYIGDSETPTYEYEDLCDDCKRLLISRLEHIFEPPIDMEPAPIPVQEEKPNIEQIDTEREYSHEQSDITEQPIQKTNETPKVMANGIINQFPIKSMRTNK